MVSAKPVDSLRAELDKPYSLTQEQIKFFQDQGYIKLKQVLSADVLEYYGKVISDEVVRLNTNKLPMEQRNTYQKAFLQVSNIWEKNETVKEFAFGKRLARIAAELMGVKGVRMYHDQALYKEPAGGITPWHADQFYWPLNTDNTITAWIPLQETPIEMGPLAFSATSHRYAVGRNLAISDDSEKQISKQLLEKGLPFVDTPFDLGEVSYHYGWTFHRAGPNTSTAPRRVMTVIYFEDGAKLIAPKHKNHEADWARWMPGCQIGEVVQTHLNPLLYRAN